MPTDESSALTDGAKEDTARDADDFNAGDPRKVAERRTKASRAYEKRRAGLRLLMQSAEGRAWMWALLGDCGIFRSCFTGNSQTFFNEGKREVGLPIMAELTEHFADEYLLMAKEAKENV